MAGIGAAAAILSGRLHELGASRKDFVPICDCGHPRRLDGRRRRRPRQTEPDNPFDAFEAIHQ
jgi:hypothetical protein